MVRICFFLFLFGVTRLDGFSQGSPCTLKNDSDGIRVYTCREPDSRLKSLKAEFVIENFPIPRFIEFFSDVSGHPRWQYNMLSSEVLEQYSKNSFITRSTIGAPWPVDNRELIVRNDFRYDEQGRIIGITTRSVDYDYTASGQFVRVPYFHAEWTLAQLGGDLYVRYDMKIDPGGTVPPWLVNIAMAEGPYQSFKKLRQLLR